MRRALLVALVVCSLGALAYGVQYVLALRAATAPATPELYVQTAWTLYRLAPGHRVHVSEQGVACEQCHGPSEQGRFDEPGPGACVRCHEEQTAIEHVQTAIDAQGHRSDGGVARMTDCLTCHGFGPDPDKQASDCLSCHAQAKGSFPAVAVHADEACTNCHDVHENSVKPIACVTCHKVETDHGGHVKGSAAQCLDCHHAHGAAASARDKCIGCHVDDRATTVSIAGTTHPKPVVPASALRSGHSCLGCHTPHRFERQEVKRCEDCHQQKAALHGAGHERCSACHAPHDVRAAIDTGNVCTSCHRETTLDHGANVDGAKGCTGCHDAHPEAGEAGPAACTTCHRDVALSDHAAHAPAQPCVTCHVPHDFDRPHEDRGVCSNCHAPRMRELSNHAGHARCESCHEALPHGGMGKETACANCHAQGDAVHRGHQTCTSCHDAHTGQRPAQLCRQCHAEQDDKLSRKHGACQNCHEPHTATPTAAIAACTGCHAVEKLPALHRVQEHQARCQSCHQAHPEAPPGKAANCRSCHDEMAGHQPEATQCSGCHPFAAPPGRGRQ